MFVKLILIVISYFLGNFATSLIISKLWANMDIRKHGSGNAGATNMYRILGAKAATLTLIGDALKGVFAVWIGRRFGGEYTALLCGMAVIIGHNWPILLGFKGGKGIATAIGVVLTVNYFIALICILLGILVLIKTKYVSLASMVGVITLPVLLLFNEGMIHFLFGLMLMAMALFRHRGNIDRLLKGNESKIK
ncbi:glycerol-3-phosphate 1-O-acyltransferase PlsY [Clostridiaceae bacterium 35-E11]